MKKGGNVNRIIAHVLAVICLGVTLAGCSDGTSESVNAEETAVMMCLKNGIKNISEASVDQPEEYENCTLQVSFRGDETKKREMNQLVELFENTYPGIEIEVVAGDGDEWEEILVQQLQAGVAPDINQIEWDWIHKYSADGELFYDLYKEYDVVQLGAFGQKYLNMCTVAEELQALPETISGKVFFFNEKLFARAGVEVPDTLEELIAAGEIFRTQLGEEYYPLAVTAEDRMELLIYYLESIFGKEWVVDGVLQYYVDEVQKGTEFLQALEEAHVIPTLQYTHSADSLSRDAGWNSGVYGGVFIDSCKCENYGIMLPSGDAGVPAKRFRDMGTGAGGYIKVEEAYAVAENCENKREAALFLNYILVQGKETVKESMHRINEIAMDTPFVMCWDYAELMRDESLYDDIMTGLSYRDYNAREAAQLLMDSFDK